MAPRLYRALVFALYQLSIVVAIALLPVALVTSRVGLPLPIGRFVARLGSASENVADGADARGPGDRRDPTDAA